MTTQAKVLQAIEKTGSYSARLYKLDCQAGVCVKGIREVAPAERLVEKGVLILKRETEELCIGGKIIHFTWVKAN